MGRGGASASRVSGVSPTTAGGRAGGPVGGPTPLSARRGMRTGVEGAGSDAVEIRQGTGRVRGTRYYYGPAGSATATRTANGYRVRWGSGGATQHITVGSAEAAHSEAVQLARSAEARRTRTAAAPGPGASDVP